MKNYHEFINEKLSIGDPTNIGIIEDEYGDQFKINSKWYHKTLVKSDTFNINTQKVKQIISKLESENGRGFITLYHGTDVNCYNRMIKDKTFGQDGYITFMTASKKEAHDYAITKAKYRGKENGRVINLTIPKWSVRYNTGSNEYETEFIFKMQDDGNWYPTDDSILKYGFN